ncbi:RHS repeat-associated core domain-containing protein [Pseudomonas sp. REP124]|uniref:RHS repeat-associated core domain-containing protein n=1 Tax=Pseudomonas sp. REP124 TaxID=2875731 RepID=UPI001CCC5FF2|nr:RHS repeat-associated core domain-containing protein [Pseudomonas sp. REP124]MBZ9783497.1 RHS repeat-associated core domain-containing protein [Pseudomonas sp. REP124]
MPGYPRKTALLATDQQRSVLRIVGASQSQTFAYTPYGRRSVENGLLSLIAFNGELPDLMTGRYHLGKGYREFNSVLMRFTKPDLSSPFGDGGMNSYAYCLGDPVNRFDPTGHVSKFWSFLRSLFGTPDNPAITVETAKDMANMKRGISFEGTTYGFELDQNPVSMKRTSVKKIEEYTNIIKEEKQELIYRTKMLLTEVTFRPERSQIVNVADEPRSTYKIVNNLSKTKNLAVHNLYREIMSFNHRAQYLRYVRSHFDVPTGRAYAASLRILP